MKVKELILKSLKQEGIGHLFMVPGGLVDPFLTAFENVPDVKPIVAAHEGGAAYMADGYARASKKFGVCLCIGGPGATNTATALLTAKSDLSPLLVISGEVAADLEGLGMFQDASIPELDDFDILKPATKLSLYIQNAKLFPHHFNHALKTLVSRKKSPIHLCLSRDVQEANLDLNQLPELDRSYYGTSLLDEGAAKLSVPFLKFTKVAILAGEGISSDKDAKALLKFSESLKIPVATTLRAKGVFPENHELSLGVFGYAGTQQAIHTFLHEDLEVLIVLGSGLNQRDSMNWTTLLNPTKQMIQVNVDLTACITSYPHTHLVEGDGGAFLDYLLKAKIEMNPTREDWVKKIKQIPRLYDIQNVISSSVPIHPARVIYDLRQVAPKNTVVLVDSGAHRAFSGHYWESYAPNEYISATNLGPMGWAIPAGIGAKLAQPHKPCCVITGDGCMLMHGMEIQTAARYHVAVIFVIINNSALGNVYLRAENEGEMAAKLTTLPDHDWVGFAESLGVKGETVRDPSLLISAFKRAFEINAPYVLDIKCDKHCVTPVKPFTESKKTWSYHD